MTLRGIGPYLRGAELNIKQLTVLCGENGSGKSTWLAVLQAFKAAAVSQAFPNPTVFPFFKTGGGDDRDFQEWIHGADRFKLNRLLRRPSQASAEDGATDSAFGNPGCVGFELAVVRAFSIDGLDHEGAPCVIGSAPVPMQLLWFGQLRSPTNLQLRWSLPFALSECRIELTLPCGAVIRLKSGKLWSFECSPVFFDEASPNDSSPVLLGVVEAELGGNMRLLQVDPDSPVSETTVTKMLSNFLILFRKLTQEMLRGFFHIGALRQYLTRESTSASPIGIYYTDREKCETTEEERNEWEANIGREEAGHAEALRIEERYVGVNGSLTQEQHAYWAYNLMRQPNVPRCGSIDNSFRSRDFPDGAVGCIGNLPTEFLTHILGIAPLELRNAWQQSDRHSSEREELGIQLLNHAIQSRNLFLRQFRPDLKGGNEELIDMLSESSDEQDERLSSPRILSDDEIRRVNRLMLEHIFHASSETKCLHRTGYLFETFVSYWLKQLTDTPVKYGEFEGRSLDTTWGIHGDDGRSHFSPPSGGLTDATRRHRTRGINAIADYHYKTGMGQTEEMDLLSTIMPPTVAGPAEWHMMSTGFHQLAPLVVQAGLLRQNEIMAVENPEAHLHPSLQIKVAEFLLHQATSGKILLIETHSDLIVRRILRAIREEQISEGTVFKQSSVGINFTSLVSAPQGFKHAKIEELEVNENGQVHNWPNGFMDDDLKEADRWLQANFHKDPSVEDSDD